jgi:pyridoxamine 5'-phosphate oxidase
MTDIFTRDDLADADPLQLFTDWYAEAQPSMHPYGDAFSLATVDDKGLPSLRMVLVKQFDQRGFVFYTNYGSRKANEITGQNTVALLAWWPALERQVRIEGGCVKTSREESEQYFATRPRESQIGAWVSHQSEVIESQSELEREFSAMTEKLADKPVICPQFWGGYRVEPIRYEFWQGRAARLHDRLRFDLDQIQGWQASRLAP